MTVRPSAARHPLRHVESGILYQDLPTAGMTPYEGGNIVDRFAIGYPQIGFAVVFGHLLFSIPGHRVLSPHASLTVKRLIYLEGLILQATTQKLEVFFWGGHINYEKSQKTRFAGEIIDASSC